MLTVAHARAVTGGLGRASKMPGATYGLPARECIRGSRLHTQAGSVCAECYALKGRYVFPNVQAAQYRRYQSLGQPEWVPAMALLINRACAKTPYFRWHDSGDLQGVWHLRRIARVCKLTPTVAHWLPTREADIVREYVETVGPLPDNLVVRVSADFVEADPPATALPTSTVHRQHGSPVRNMERPNASIECRAYVREGRCGPCRACWSPKVKNVSYSAH